MTRSYGSKVRTRQSHQADLTMRVLYLDDAGELDTLNLREWARRTGWSEERVFQRANEIVRDRREVRANAR